jgi:RNA polymerase sigma-70 factor (ECF subfamily)
MTAVREGDLGRLGDLFQRHQHRLFGFFSRLTGNSAASEDLVQEVFVRMLKYRHTYRSEGSFVAWMFTLARNAAADRRSREREDRIADLGPREGEASDPLEALPADQPAAIDTLLKSEAERRLRRALSKLPLEKRELLLLARFRYLPYQEIAAQLGTTVGAVKVRVHRAVKDLRAQMALETGAEVA